MLLLLRLRSYPEIVWSALPNGLCRELCEPGELCVAPGGAIEVS